MFQPKCPSTIVENINAAFGIKIVKTHTKYLGLPLSKNQRDIFASISTRESVVVATWKGRLISSTGKEDLINFVT